MSRDKGNRAAGWVAAYMRENGFPHAEALPNGRAGADIKGTPGVAVEVKTGKTWREEWLAQAAKYDGRVKFVVWLLPGIGERNVALAPVIMPEPMLAKLISEAHEARGRPALDLAYTRGIEWRANWKGLTGAIIYQPPAPRTVQGIVQMRVQMQMLAAAEYCKPPSMA